MMPEMLNDMRQIRVELIDDNDLNFYGTENVNDLCESIAMSGVLQPIIVMAQADGRYLLVAGHRRTKAVRQLRNEWNGEGENPFDTIPAIVKPLPENEMQGLLAELQLIQTNSAARRLSDPEIAKQAERLTEIFYKLKEYGYEFPGRMRETVAKAVGVSSAKIGRLKFIQEHLSASWLERWEAGKLTERAAEALARHDPERQNILLYLKNPVLDNIDSLLRYYNKTHGDAQQCILNKKKSCTNMENFWLAGRTKKSWDFCGFGCTFICCKNCSKIQKCNRVCAEAYNANMKEHERLRKVERKNEEERQQEADMMTERWEYFRQQSGLNVAQFDEAAGFFGRYSESIENPNHTARKVGLHKYFSFERIYEAAKVLGVAPEALRDPKWEPDGKAALQKCSGKAGNAADVQRNCWTPVKKSVPEDGALVLILRFSTIMDEWMKEPHAAIYRDGNWYHPEEAAQDIEWTGVRFWAPWPEMEDE